VRLVVPYPPGGNVDGAARIVANKLQEKLGQPVVIENKAGAGGLIAGEMVAKSPPDGYTLFVGANGPILFAPEITGKHPYEWSKDFVPVSTISLTPLVLQVHPSVTAQTLKEFFELAKRDPGKLNMASPGPGTTNHLLSELLQSTANVSWTTVHYKGNAPATNDLIAGHVQFNFDQISVALPFLKEGRTHALAVTGTKRAHWIPDVPTFAELGYQDVVGQTFTALMAPAGTPASIIARLNAALTEVLRDKDVIEKFDLLGAEAVAMSPDETRKYLSSEGATWMPIVRKANIKAE
jgi:tripartite-type tricarboxylate transporter receptor subunit TctC